LAGTGHVLFTALLGVLIAWFGIALHERIGNWFPWIAGGVLIVFGLFYLYRQVSGTGHKHSHIFGGHSHHGSVPHLHTPSPKDTGSTRPPHGGKLIDTGNGLLEIAISAEHDESRFCLYPIPAPNQHAGVLSSAGITLETI